MVQRHQEGSSTLDPVIARVLWRQLEVDLHLVGGLGDVTLALGVVVAGALVDIGLHLASLDDGLEPNHRHLHVQLHDFWLAQVLLVVVPLRTFKVEAVDVSAFFDLLNNLLHGALVGVEVEL